MVAAAKTTSCWRPITCRTISSPLLDTVKPGVEFRTGSYKALGGNTMATGLVAFASPDGKRPGGSCVASRSWPRAACRFPSCSIARTRPSGRHGRGEIRGLLSRVQRQGAANLPPWRRADNFLDWKRRAIDGVPRRRRRFGTRRAPLHQPDAVSISAPHLCVSIAARFMPGATEVMLKLIDEALSDPCEPRLLQGHLGRHLHDHARRPPVRSDLSWRMSSVLGIPVSRTARFADGITRP